MYERNVLYEDRYNASGLEQKGKRNAHESLMHFTLSKRYFIGRIVRSCKVVVVVSTTCCVQKWPYRNAFFDTPPLFHIPQNNVFVYVQEKCTVNNEHTTCSDYIVNYALGRKQRLADIINYKLIYILLYKSTQFEYLMYKSCMENTVLIR